MIMKKNIFKLFSAMVVSATVLTGCIEEVFPEDSTATSDQIGASATAIEASLNGLPSQMVQVIWCTVSKPMRPTLLIPH